MNELIQQLNIIRNNIRFSKDLHAEIPDDLHGHLCELVGNVSFEYPKDAIFFTKKERLDFAKLFVRLSRSVEIHNWRESYIPLYFTDEKCDHFVVIDSCTRNFSILDFQKSTVFYIFENNLPVYSVPFDIENTIKSNFCHHEEGKRSGYLNVLFTAAALAAGVTAWFYFGDISLESSLDGTPKENTPRVSLERIPQRIFDENFDDIAVFQCIGHSH